MEQVDWRKSVKTTISMVGRIAALRFKLMIDANKYRFLVAYQEHSSSLQKQSADEYFVPEHGPLVIPPPQPAVGVVNSDLLLQGPPPPCGGAEIGNGPNPVRRFRIHEKTFDWTSAHMEGLDNDYLCRNIERRACLPNVVWIQEIQPEHFRCPCCWA